ncbi:MAG: glycosyltransferase family 2 protein [Solirubrobacterales bacterium]|nr:glycosyltransferase family 2 protein [Solirubrobacterales bacterium]
MKTLEPELLARPRVHRFATVPLLGEALMPPRDVAIWIEGEGETPSVARAALAAQTAQPAAVHTGSLRDALANTRADYMALIQAEDTPAELALERLGQAAALAPDAALITCDDDQLERSGRRRRPRLRPGPSPERWLSLDDSGPLLVVKRDAAAKAIPELSSRGGWRHELALRLAGTAAQAHAHVPLLLCHRGPGASNPAPLDAESIRQIIGAARVEETHGVRKVRRAINGEPRVEIVICFRDQPDLLARCVTSVLERTSYDRVSLALVDNDSSDSATLELLSRFSRRPNIRILRDERPFNFAALNNLAAGTSQAEVLLFLNNDTEVTQDDWLELLLEEALRPEVGAVAPLLLYPDGAVQHAGAAIGMHDYAGHPFAGLRPDAATPFGHPAQGTRNWLAVTAACMMLERTKFEAVGGFDEAFVVAGNDVDLCLRLTAAGYRSLCVTHSAMVHDESQSRGAHIDPSDFVRSEQSYGEFRTVGDPFYNPSLTLKTTDCGLRYPDEVFRELPRTH